MKMERKSKEKRRKSTNELSAFDLANPAWTGQGGAISEGMFLSFLYLCSHKVSDRSRKMPSVPTKWRSKKK